MRRSEWDALGGAEGLIGGHARSPKTEEYATLGALRSLLVIAGDVVRDYGDTCCDNAAGCQCSMARLARFVGEADYREGWAVPS